MSVALRTKSKRRKALCDDSNKQMKKTLVVEEAAPVTPLHRRDSSLPRTGLLTAIAFVFLCVGDLKMVPNFFVCVSEEEERGKEKRKRREEKKKKKKKEEAALESYRVLRGWVNGLGYSPDARLIPYLELAGFGSAVLIRTFDLQYDLISVLVERWRPETHTFHLSCGECTVTLEDVALQLGLPIDGSSVTGISTIAEPAALCYSLLGASPGDDESNLSGLKFTWLKANFQHLPDNATEEELMCAARAGVLMPDANNNRVHIMYLPLLTDLHNVRSYSWGSASWALYRMPFLASVSQQPYVYPLVNRWSIYPGIGRSYTVPIYRLLIEQHAGEGFIWMLYRRPEIVAVIPSSAYVHSQLWCTNAPIINFNVVEWYHGDRVLRQFGCIQYIPNPPKEVGKAHGINKRGKHGMHWGVVHRRYIAV
ncbi:hypothetical protein CXB51_013808 [Gossypium anomalum]|uniref:Aminotransferase-like plant mobile domain-containing protein n=1 Tax=Gossypium anomalum TaxID=47600 RepID=A0A8J5YWR0_9ROSI|nr:hypothetical protein CXB51_013808 [Gossypium anomalum]